MKIQRIQIDGVITIRLPYDTLPLRSNDRMHWAQKAKVVRQVRADAAHLAMDWAWKYALPGDYPISKPVIVTLVWEVTTKHRRDVGAGSPTLKACIDGLVDGGLLGGDHSPMVAEERTRIEVGNQRGVRVEIRSVTE